MPAVKSMGSRVDTRGSTHSNVSNFKPFQPPSNLLPRDPSTQGTTVVVFEVNVRSDCTCKPSGFQRTFLSRAGVELSVF